MNTPRQGSAIFIVVLLIAVISGLLLTVQYRCSLLLETVYAREKQLQIIYARQALLFYAITLAKHNWSNIRTSIKKKGSASYTGIAWPVTPDKTVEGNVHYMAAGSDIHIKIEIKGYKDLSCVLQRDGTSEQPVYRVFDCCEHV